MNLIDAQAAMWGRMTARVAALEDRVARLEQRSERAEVAGGTPRFDTPGNLPTGALGMIATVVDTGGGAGGFYWHDGTSWNKVYP